ncbi:hypothetical protein [Cryobacterium sp. Y29]|uniref:hypothetical protein n=1 Tax=Cryobacterium sp. Y29 TaxID=2048285 RepID=UPI000CE3F1A4|nr:hypothetical protein [Cryobacterium sp. Y29]
MRSHRCGAISIENVTAGLAVRYGADPELTLRFAEALDLFWKERHSDAARILIPLIEASARGLLLRLDVAIYRLERGNSSGHFPAMDFYVDKLEALDLDHDWIRALRVALLSPGSNMRNMRNTAAHGFRFDFGASETAILLRLAGLFCALPAKVDAAELRDLPPRPLEWLRRRLRRRLGWVWQ